MREFVPPTTVAPFIRLYVMGIVNLVFVCKKMSTGANYLEEQIVTENVDRCTL